MWSCNNGMLVGVIVGLASVIKNNLESRNKSVLDIQSAHRTRERKETHIASSSKVRLPNTGTIPFQGGGFVHSGCCLW